MEHTNQGDSVLATESGRRCACRWFGSRVFALGGRSIGRRLTAKAPPVAIWLRAPGPASTSVETSVVGGAGDHTYANPFLSVSTGNGGSRVIGGGQIGYNWQSGAAVFGIEAGHPVAHLGRNPGVPDTHDDGVFAGGPFGTDAGDDLTLRRQQTGSALLGYAAILSSPDITGGLAYGDVKHVYTETAGRRPKVTTARDHAGGDPIRRTVGVVSSWAFSNQWSLGAEYLYVDLGDTTPASLWRPVFLVRQRPCSHRREPGSKRHSRLPARADFGFPAR